MTTSSAAAINSDPDYSVDYSIIVPIYLNAATIKALIDRLHSIADELGDQVEVVFVIDGCPENSYAELMNRLPDNNLNAVVLNLSRNFGSFAAIREGLRAANGKYFAVMAADLQEPEELAKEMLIALAENRADVVTGTRISRSDPWSSQLFSRLFWRMQKRIVQPDMPAGGIDVFGCNRAFRDGLLRLEENHTSLVGQLFWLGFRRLEIPYQRLPRSSGKSGWNWSRKRKYFFDSLFAFTDLPIRIFTLLGLLGILTSIVLGLVVLIARITGQIDMPGYAATVLTIVFFAGLNLFGIGIVGNYVWRTYENTKQRPLAVVMSKHEFPKP
ncbi:MAG: glycosyltransferase family 2 protein [Pseudomonadota bacterium]